MAQALVRRGATPVRLDTDLFPNDVSLSLSQQRNSTSALLHLPEGDIDLTDVSSVWYRRFAPGHGLPSDMEMRSAAILESRAALEGVIEVLPSFHLDHITNVRRAGNKPLQLKWASEVGLSVPNTLVTNDENDVREFASGCPNGLVAKTLSSFVVRNSSGAELAVYTTPVSESDLQELAGLRLSPMLFQERVPKAFDLRCTIVGSAVFAAALDARLLEDQQVDWRLQGSELADVWQTHLLPAGVERALLTLLDRFGLNYGAIDMILTPEGEYVFLEVNPAGEFLWLDDLGPLAISDALAGVLVGIDWRIGPGASSH